MQDFGSLIIMGPEMEDFDNGLEVVYKRILQSKGIPLDEITDLIVKKLIAEQKNAMEQKLIHDGFPKILENLFSLKKKSDVMKMVKTITLTKDELVRAIFNANFLGFTYLKKHKYFIPDDIKPTNEEKEALSNNGIGLIRSKKAKKFVKKIGEHFKKRKVISSHLFFKDNEWHLLYFDYNDAYVKTQNHFKGGPHIHYTSFLLTSMTREVVWDMLDNRQVKIQSTHLRYDPQQDDYKD